MNELTNIYTERLFNDVNSIIINGQRQAFGAAGQVAIATYWNIGRRIVEEEQQGELRAQYGARLITDLAERLYAIYGNNYSKRNL